MVGANIKRPTEMGEFMNEAHVLTHEWPLHGRNDPVGKTSRLSLVIKNRYETSQDCDPLSSGDKDNELVSASVNIKEYSV